jgi:SHS2 domain-containing protein
MYAKDAMKKYKLLPHTADVRLKIEASNLEELFFAAMEGMAEIIKPRCCQTTTPPYTQQETIKISSLDTTTLIIDFLSTVLTYSQMHKTLYCNVKFKKLDTDSLHATIFGIPVDSFDEDIKAVTYHEAEVKKNAHNNWETIIIFDI